MDNEDLSLNANFAQAIDEVGKLAASISKMEGHLAKSDKSFGAMVKAQKTSAKAMESMAKAIETLGQGFAGSVGKVNNLTKSLVSLKNAEKEASTEASKATKNAETAYKRRATMAKKMLGMMQADANKFAISTTKEQDRMIAAQSRLLQVLSRTKGMTYDKMKSFMDRKYTDQDLQSFGLAIVAIQRLQAAYEGLGNTATKVAIKRIKEAEKVALAEEKAAMKAALAAERAAEKQKIQANRTAALVQKHLALTRKEYEYSYWLRLENEKKPLMSLGGSDKENMAIIRARQAVVRAAKQGGIQGFDIGGLSDSFNTGRLDLSIAANQKLAQALMQLRGAYAAVGSAEMKRLQQLEKQRLKTLEANNAAKEFILSWGSAVRIMAVQALHASVYRLVSGLFEGIEAAKKLNKAIAEIRTIGDKTTGVEGWREAITEMSNQYGVDALNIAESSYQALSDQIIETKQEFIEFGTAAQRFATAAVTDTASAVTLLSSVLNAYSLKASDAESISAKLFKMIDLGRFRAEDLKDTIGRVAIMASQLGVSFDELGAAMTVMTRQGITADEAMTQIRGMFSKFLKPSKEMARVFKDLGVSSGEAFFKIYGLNEGLKVLMQYTGGSSTELSKLFPLMRGLTGAMAITGKNARSLAQDTYEISNAWEDYNNAVNIVMESSFKKLDKEITRARNMLRDWGFSIVEVAGQFGGLDTIVTIFANTIGHVFVTALVAAIAKLVTLERLTLILKSSLTWYLVAANALVRVIGYIATESNSKWEKLGETFIEVRDKYSKLDYAFKESLNNTLNAINTSIEKGSKTAVEAASKYISNLNREMNIYIKSMENVKDITSIILSEIESDYKKAISGLQSQYEKARRTIEDLEASSDKATVDRDEHKNDIGKIFAKEDPKSQIEELQKEYEKLKANLNDSDYDLFKTQLSRMREIIKEQASLKHKALMDERAELEREQKKEFAADKKNAKDIAAEAKREAGVQKQIDDLEFRRKQGREDYARRMSRLNDSRMPGGRHTSMQSDRNRQRAIQEAAANERQAEEKFNRERAQLIQKLNDAKAIAPGGDPEEQAKRIKQIHQEDNDARIAALKQADELATLEIEKRRKMIEDQKQAAQAMRDQYMQQKQEEVYVSGQMDVFSKAKVKDVTDIKDASDLKTYNDELQAAYDVIKKVNASLSTPQSEAMMANFEEKYKILTDAIAAQNNKIIMESATKAREESEKNLKQSLEALRLQQQELNQIKSSIAAGRETIAPTLDAASKLEDVFKRGKTKGSYTSNTVIDYMLFGDTTGIEQFLEKTGLDLGSGAEFGGSGKQKKMAYDRIQYYMKLLKEIKDVADSDPVKAVKNLDKVIAAFGKKGLSESAVTFQNSLKAMREALTKAGKGNVEAEMKKIQDQLESFPKAMKSAGEEWHQAATSMVEDTNAVIENVRKMRDAYIEAGKTIKDLGGKAPGKALGGTIYRSGGGFIPRGTDTVPAMLTPGEFVVNASSAKKFYAQLLAINSGMKPVYRSEGGSVDVGGISVTVNAAANPQKTAREVVDAINRGIRQGTLKIRSN